MYVRSHWRGHPARIAHGRRLEQARRSVHSLPMVSGQDARSTVARASCPHCPWEAKGTCAKLRPFSPHGLRARCPVHGGAGILPNTVSLANHDGGLPDSRYRLGSAFPHGELGSGLCLDGARRAPAPAAFGFGFSKVRAHPREHRRPCLRGKCSGPGL